MSRSKDKPAPAAAVPRVVFDTGVLLRALLLPGETGAALRRAWQEGRCRALVDAASARALMTALAAPALRLAPAERQELLADFLPYAEVVPPGEAAAAESTSAARLDPLDGLALALAQAGGAALLVSDSPVLHARFRGKPGTKRTPAVRGVLQLRGSAEFFAAP